MTLFRILQASSGLSLREAADFLDVSINTVKSWSSGRNNTPPGVIDEMQALVGKQERAAEETRKIILNAIASETPATIELGCAADDHEAQSIGWPTASAQMAMIGRLLGKLSVEDRPLIKIVPRGTTLATAAAEVNH